jgi:hypothetical protein
MKEENSKDVETIQQDIDAIEKIFKSNSLDDMPCNLVNHINEHFNKIYKHSLGGTMGIYYLGYIHGSRDRR